MNDSKGLKANQTNLEINNFQREKVKINDEEFEKFQNVLCKDLVLELYSIFKIFEKNGLINYNIYLESMTQIFKKYNKEKNHNFKDIFNLIFNRYQKIKCIMKNDKKIFYLTNMLPQNFIETYTIVCFLTVFIKCRIIDKMKLLFELTDVDEDGFLNKEEIKQMISTINLMFSEETSLINTNSSILAQSLMNLKVKEKIYKILYDPGNLNIELQKEKYICFDSFYNSLKKIKNYKYEIFPSFINMKQCLYNKRNEKVFEIKHTFKKQFVRAKSALASNKFMNPLKTLKKSFSVRHLGRIIKNVKINNDNDMGIVKKKQLLLGIKEKTKTFRELLKESTVFSEDENSNEIGEREDTEHLKSFEDLGMSSTSKGISFHNITKEKPLYIFEADFDKIKKIEVEPGLIKFLENENKIKEIEDNLNNKGFSRHISGLTNKSKYYKKNVLNKRKILSTKDLSHFQFKHLNSKKSKNLDNFDKKENIESLQIQNNLFKNFQFKKKEQNSNLYSNIFKSKNNSSKNSLIKEDNSSKNELKKYISNNFLDIKNDIKKINKKNKNNNKRPFSSFNITKFKKGFMPKKEKTFISKKNSVIRDSFLKNNSPIHHNAFKFKQKNKYNNIASRNRIKKNFDSNKIIYKYLSTNDILRDVDKNEEKLRHERSEYFGKELIALYKKMIKEKKEIRAMIGKYDKYHISLNFFDFKKKGYPKDYGKSIFSSNKDY